MFGRYGEDNSQSDHRIHKEWLVLLSRERAASDVELKIGARPMIPLHLAWTVFVLPAPTQPVI